MTRLGLFVDRRVPRAAYIPILVSLALILVVVVVPRPYQFVIGDYEPDYLGNAMHVLKWGFPMSSHHPGTPLYYFLALVLAAAGKLHLDLQNTILLSRVVLLSCSLGFVYFGGVLYGRNANRTFIAAAALTFLLPPLNFYVDLLSPEAILYGLGFYIIARIYRYSESGLSSAGLLPFFIGLACAIKLSALGLLVIVAAMQATKLLKTLLLHKYVDAGTLAKGVARFHLIFIATFLVCVSPVLPRVEAFQNMVGRLQDDIGLSTIAALAFLVIAACLTAFALLRKRVMAASDLSVFLVVGRCGVAAIAVGLVGYLLYCRSTMDTFLYESFSFSTRHVVPYVGMAFVPGLVWSNSAKRKVLQAKSLTALTIVLLTLCVLVKSHVNLGIQANARKYDESFRLLLGEATKYSDYVLVYPASEFSSKSLFGLWTEKRYGNGMIDFRKRFPETGAAGSAGAGIEFVNFSSDYETGSMPSPNSATPSSKKTIKSLLVSFIPGGASSRRLRDRMERSLYRENYSSAYPFLRTFGFPVCAWGYSARFGLPNSEHRTVIVVPKQLDYFVADSGKGHYFFKRLKLSPGAGQAYIASVHAKLQQNHISYMEKDVKIDETSFHLIVADRSGQLTPSSKQSPPGCEAAG